MSLKKTSCLLICLLLGCPLAIADQIRDLEPTDVDAANAVLRAPLAAQALLSCPEEMHAMARAGAEIVSGRVTTSRFGIAYVFEFAKGSKRAELEIRKTTRLPSGKSLGQPRLECSLTDSTSLK